MLSANYCSNRKMLKFDNEITKSKMLKRMTMNCSCEYFTHNNKFHVILKNNILIKISVLNLLHY